MIYVQDGEGKIRNKKSGKQFIVDTSIISVSNGFKILPNININYYARVCNISLNEARSIFGRVFD